jgi:ligand-binding sensor domain-containing protein/signal transduction histidine kinase
LPPRFHVVVVWMLFVAAIAALPGSTPAYAQTQPLGSPTRLERMPVSPYLIDAWTSEEGLPQNTVNALTQTRDGYIWLATFGGLVRFDGRSFRTFAAANTPGLGADRILTLYEDRGGALWIGTERDGVFVSRQGVFSRPSWHRRLPSRQVWAIYQTRDDALWFGTSEGAVRVDRRERVTIIAPRDGRSVQSVRAIAESPNGTVWLGLHGRGLTRVVDGVLRPFSFFETGEEALVNVITIGRRSGVVWVGTQGGLFRLRGERAERVPLAGDVGAAPVRAIVADETAGVWVGTRRGLCHLRPDATACYGMEAGLSDAFVRAMGHDREGNLWIGTNIGGLNRLKRRKAVAYVPQRGRGSSLSFLPIVGDGAGGLWAGATCGGLVHFSRGLFEVYGKAQGLPRDCIWAIHRDPDGTLWLGTPGGGLFRVEDGRVERFSAASGLPNDSVLAVTRDRAGVLWAGTYGALNRMTSDGTFESYRLPIQAASVSFITERRAGGVWLGTTAGLFRFVDGRFKRWSTAEGLSHDVVRALLEDPDGTIWLGTYGGGLNRLHGEQVTRYTSANGLYDDVVSRILDDGRGNLWMSGNRGVFRVARRELDAVARGRATAVTSVWYDTTDGMATSETNGGGQPAGWRGPDGRLWFPTIEGLVAFDPSAPTNRHPPPVVVTRVVVDREERDPRGELVVPAGAQNVEIHYAGLSFVAPEKVRFRYQLEGYDRDWIDAGTRREAYYTGLPPGQYRFRVRARNEDGVWSAEDAVLGLRQQPYMYQTWWFAIGCTLLLTAMMALLLYAFHRLRLERALALERMRMRIATDLHDDIGGTLSRMAILSEVARRQAVLPPDVERRLDNLGETARGLVDAMSDVVWSIDPRRDHLASLLLRVREHATDVLEGTPLTFESPPDAETVHLRPDQRRQLYLILKEALTNVAKHARAQHVAVTVTANGDALDVEVRDDGRGFDTAASDPLQSLDYAGRAPRQVFHPGNGLQNMRGRAAGLDGSLTIRSGPGGTTLRVRMPLGRSARATPAGAAALPASTPPPRPSQPEPQRHTAWVNVERGGRFARRRSG